MNVDQFIRTLLLLLGMVFANWGWSQSVTPSYEGEWQVVTVEFNGQARTTNHPFSVLILDTDEFSLRDREGAEFSFLEFEHRETETGFDFYNPENEDQSIRFEWTAGNAAILTGSNYVFFIERKQ